MRFFTTSDANSESKINEILNALDDSYFNEYFADKYYDDSGIEMAVVFMCRDPRRNFKQRIRFVKKENTLYMDIMLDLNVMSCSDSETRRRIVGDKMVNEIPEIIHKYKFNDFDLPRFTKDLREWFEDNGWIEKRGNG